MSHDAISTLILCGASVRSLAASAIAAGLHPLCVDFFADDDLLQLLACGRGRMLACIEGFAQLPMVVNKVPAGTPVLWSGGLENHPDILEQIDERNPLLGTCPATIRSVRDPFLLGRCLRDAGLLFPNTVTCPVDQPSPNEQDGAQTWLRKHRARAGGSGIAEMPDPENALTGCHSSDCYLQEKISGVPMSALFVADMGIVRLVGCSLQLTGLDCVHAAGFQFCGNFGPVSLPQQLTETIRAAGQSVVDWSGLTGVFGIDWILSNGHPWFLEVNPRITASHELYEFAQDARLVSEHLTACLKLRSRHDGRPQFSRHSAQFRNVSDRFSNVSTGMAAHGHTTESAGRSHESPCMLRLIVYANRTLPASELFSRGVREGLSATAPNLRTGVSRGDDERTVPGTSPGSPLPRLWLADIPAAETIIGARKPVCSVYGVGNSMEQIVQLLTTADADAEPTGLSALQSVLPLSSASIAATLRQLWRDVQKNPST